MFENPRRGRQARNFTKKCSENSRYQIVFRTDIFRKLTLGAPDLCLLMRIIVLTLASLHLGVLTYSASLIQRLFLHPGVLHPYMVLRSTVLITSEGLTSRVLTSTSLTYVQRSYIKKPYVERCYIQGSYVQES